MLIPSEFWNNTNNEKFISYFTNKSCHILPGGGNANVGPEIHK